MFNKSVPTSLIFLLPFEKGVVYSIPLLFTVSNVGGRSAKNVRVLLELAEELYVSGIERTPDKVSKVLNVDVVADVGRNKHLARVLVALPDIPPRSAVSFNDFVFVRKPTVADVSVTETTRDGVPVRVEARVDYSYSLNLAVQAEDQRPVTLEASFAFREGGVEMVSQEHALSLMMSPNYRPSGNPWALVGFERFVDREDGQINIMDGNSESMKILRVEPR
jgi:hypothetical protein